jgi:transposase
MSKKKSIEEKTMLVDRVEELRKAGHSTESAASELGIGVNSYYAWRKETKKFMRKNKITRKKSKPEQTTIMLPPEDDRVFLFQGTRQDLQNLINLMKK